MKEILNRAAKWGLLLGVVMSVSKVIEIGMLLSGQIGLTLLIMIEMLVACSLFIYICYRANVERKMLCDEPSEYGLRSVCNYSIVVSIFAGVIVGIVAHIYISSALGGYYNYQQEFVVAMTSLMDSAQMPAESREEYMQMYDAMIDSEQSGSISIVESVVSAVMNYIIGGFVVGLIITRFVKRRGVVKDVEEGANEQ